MSGNKLMLLVNPHAGKGGAVSALGEVLQVFCRAGWAPTVYMTEKRGDAPRLAREHAADYDRIVCIGGDGTLSETVAGIVTLPGAPPLGYIPMGTANDVATTLGLSRDPVEAAQTIVSGTPHPLDVGCMNGDSFFTYIAAFGAFTDVSYETRQESKQALGLLAYLLEGLGALPKITPTHARVLLDDGEEEGDYIFCGVTNSTSVAGMVRLDKGIVSLSDGLFEVILVKNPESIGYLSNIVIDILGKKYQDPHVKVLHSRTVHFLCEEPVKFTRDGEAGGLHGDVTLENLHQAIRIVL